MSAHFTSQDEFFSACYLDYQGVIKNYISSRIPCSYEAEDLLHDVFVRLWEYREFVNRETVKSLLFTIARNLITDKIRRYYKKEDFYSYIYNTQAPQQNTTEDVVAYNELTILHHAAVNALPNKRRRIYELCFHQDMTGAVVADRLSVSIRTVEGQLLLARKSVRAFLREQYNRVS